MRVSPDFTIEPTRPEPPPSFPVEPPPEVGYDPLPVASWAELFSASESVDALVEGLVVPGRWVSLVAAAKVGKSSLLLHLAHTLARGSDPFTRAPRDPVRVLYLDLEMGRLDVVERLTDLGLGPDDLVMLGYTDLVPKADALQGATAIVSKVLSVGYALVIIDGLNGLIDGAEKDDVPWRRVFDYLIAPLKRAGVAVLSADNAGKDRTLGARGSSVKQDKPDAVIELTRTDDGVQLRATHRRTAAVAAELLLVVSGVDGDAPLDYRTATHSWPAGTATAAATLNRLGVPLDHGRNRVRERLKTEGIRMRDTVLAAAIKYRQITAQTGGNRSGNRSREQVSA